MKPYIVASVDRKGDILATERDSMKEAIDSAKAFAAGNPGKEYVVYERKTVFVGEVTVKEK